MELFNERLLVLEQCIQSETFWEAQTVGILDFLGLLFGDNLLLVVVLEELFKLGLVENHDIAVNDGRFVALWHLNSDISREWLKAFTVQFPAKLAFKCRAGGETLGNIESFLTFVARICKARNNAFDTLEFILIVGEIGDILVLVFDEMNEGFGAANLAEVNTVDNLIFPVRKFVFANFQALVGLVVDELNRLKHKHRANCLHESIAVAHFVWCVVFVE